MLRGAAPQAAKPECSKRPPCQPSPFLLDCEEAPAATAGRRRAMTPFFVQIKCELGKSYQVANALAEAEIASEVYSTAGDYDLLVKFYVEAGTDIGHFVNEKVQCIPGIKDTHTIITFKAFQV
jgi:DNA-binding Lrp family transcriptional regulator